MKSRTLALALVAMLVSGCALIPVKPVNQRPAPRVTCSTALVFYGNPQTGELAGSQWGKVCSDGRIVPAPLPWYLRLYLWSGEKLADLGVIR